MCIVNDTVERGVKLVEEFNEIFTENEIEMQYFTTNEYNKSVYNNNNVIKLHTHYLFEYFNRTVCTEISTFKCILVI